MESSSLPAAWLYHTRYLDRVIAARLEDFPALLISGGRATGKSTTARRHSSTVVRLDDPAQAAPFRADLHGAFERRLRAGKPVLFDEYQEVPGLLWEVKRAVDDGLEPGSVILTGSVRPAPDSVKPTFGRIHHLPLWPMTQAEIGTPPSADDTSLPRPLVDRLLQEPPSEWPIEERQWSSEDYADAICRGGFPRAALANNRTSQLILRDLASDIVATARDTRARIDTAAFGRWLKATATQTAQQPQLATMLDAVGINRRTANGYDQLLEDMFLLQLVPGLAASHLKRLTKTPKRYLTDSGLSSSLQGIDPTNLPDQVTAFGSLMDTFVTQQVRGQLTGSETSWRLSHARFDTGKEVDLILESSFGTVGVEVTTQMDPSSHRKSATLRQLIERDSALDLGIVFYSGTEIWPLAKQVWAVPTSTLWA